MYRRLDAARIVATAEQLTRRIEERFPDSGLNRVARELVGLTEQAARDAEWFRRPHRAVRVAIAGLIALLLVVVIGALVTVVPRPAEASLTEWLQASESAIQDLVFLGIGIYFLLSLEVRRKRRRALVAMHDLRAMAHIIDMHQLTKDPERLTRPNPSLDTPSSPTRQLSPFELSRYLDYSSEMLSLLSKAAALYIQDFDDPVTIATVNDVESLTTGLSRKIWQKIMILDRMVGAGEP
jgi:hypothetical protein